MLKHQYHHEEWQKQVEKLTEERESCFWEQRERRERCLRVYETTETKAERGSEPERAWEAGKEKVKKIITAGGGKAVSVLLRRASSRRTE
eukprot:5501449-Pleurochrysis_carterae.AAC.1